MDVALLRPRRELLARAFDRALQGKHAGIIDQTPLTGMGIDTAFVILRKTEALRDKYGRGSGSILRANVRRAAVASGLPPDRRYAYEVVLMNYYGLIKTYQSEIARKRRDILASRLQQLAAA